MSIKTIVIRTTRSTAIATATAFALTSTATAGQLAPLGDQEAARVITLVSSIPMAVDLAAYDLAERAFAPSVVIDYTSLWGGKPSTMTPAELMTAWRGIVPGFDVTWHELSDVEAKVTGDKAEATAAVDGRHWIGDALWRPIGNYRWQLVRKNGSWKVTHMTFSMTREVGDRGLAIKATERAKAKQVKAKQVKAKRN